MMKLRLSALLLCLSLSLPLYATLSPLTPHALLAQGITLLQKEKYEKAQQCFEGYLQAYPQGLNTTEVQYYVAFCAIKLNQPNGETRFKQFVQQHPHHRKAALAYYQLGNLYFSNQNFAKSIEYYLQVAQRKLDQDTQVALQYQIAYAYMNEKNFDQALQYFNTIKGYENTYQHAASYYAGYLAYRVGDYEVALQDLKNAYTHDTYKPVVPCLILQVYYKQRRFQELLEYIEAVHRTDIVLKNQEEIALLTAEAYFLCQQYAPAARYYEEYLGLKNFAVTSPILYRLAYALYHADETHKALQYFKELAMQEDAIGQKASYYLGLLYIKVNQKERARPALQKACNAAFAQEIKENAVLQYAKLNYDLGDYAETIAAIQNFTQVYPLSQHQQEVDLLLSEAYLRTKDYGLAIAHIERHSQHNKTTARTYQQATFYKGSEHFNNQAYDQAIRHFKKSLQHTPNQDIALQAQLWLGESYAAQQTYDQAIDVYKQVLQAASPKTYYYPKALYGIAYAYFNTQDYQQALKYFELYARYEKQREWLRDAQLRIADCYYVTKAYDKAFNRYQKLRKRYPAHVTYQQAMIHSLRGNLSQAQREMQKVVDHYAHTPYYEKALFEKAHLVFAQSKYARAIQDYTAFIVKKPYSQCVPDALLHRAVAHVNLKQYDQAIEDYALLLKDYPTHSNTQSALLELPKILQIQGKSEAFQQYLESYKAAHPNSTPALEQLTFDAAKNLFYEQKYLPALEQLASFVARYPESRLTPEARFLVAEAYYRTNELAQAQAHYEKALEDKQSPFYSKILYRLATLAYKQQDFAQALQHYQALKAAAATKKEVYYALEGIMKTSHALKQYNIVDQAASHIVAQGNVTVNATQEAHLFLGKSAIQQKRIPKAMQYLQQVTQDSQDQYAAEAQYLIAVLHHQAGEYQKSLAALFLLNKQFPAYKTWIDKGFLLIANNYIALKDNFQATATLQSIIDNAKTPAIVEAAKKRLAKLPQKSDSDVKLSKEEAPTPEEEKEFRTIKE